MGLNYNGKSRVKKRRLLGWLLDMTVLTARSMKDDLIFGMCHMYNRKLICYACLMLLNFIPTLKCVTVGSKMKNFILCVFILSAVSVKTGKAFVGYVTLSCDTIFQFRTILATSIFW